MKTFNPTRNRLGRAGIRLPSLLIAVLLPVAASVSAHQPGTSSIVLTIDQEQVLHGEVHMTDVDLAAVQLMLSLQAKQAAQAAPDDPVPQANDLPWMRLSAGGVSLPFRTGRPWASNTDGRPHTVIPFSTPLSGQSEIAVEYVDFFGFDPQHKEVTSLAVGGEVRVGLLSQQERAWRTPTTGRGPAGQFAKFTWEGVWHIWIGIDHILFLLALLLPSVLTFSDGRWRPVTGFRQALINVLKVVTAFTVAHSVTLSLAALQIVTLPSRFVESVIALSVLLAALNNIWPVVRDRAWLVAFGFGLVHGFGFANVLADLQLPSGTLAIALVSFNIGVELGQLAIVSVFFPVAFSVRDSRFYQPVKLRLGSAVIGVIALGWIVQRVFEVEVMPF